jgi:hypothetical protein
MAASTLSQIFAERDLEEFIEKVSKPPPQPRRPRRISEISFFCIAERRTEIEIDLNDL